MFHKIAENMRVWKYEKNNEKKYEIVCIAAGVREGVGGWGGEGAREGEKVAAGAAG